MNDNRPPDAQVPPAPSNLDTSGLDRHEAQTNLEGLLLGWKQHAVTLMRRIAQLLQERTSLIEERAGLQQQNQQLEEDLAATERSHATLKTAGDRTGEIIARSQQDLAESQKESEAMLKKAGLVAFVVILFCAAVWLRDPLIHVASAIYNGYHPDRGPMRLAGDVPPPAAPAGMTLTKAEVEGVVDAKLAPVIIGLNTVNANVVAASAKMDMANTGISTINTSINTMGEGLTNSVNATKEFNATVATRADLDAQPKPLTLEQFDARLKAVGEKRAAAAEAAKVAGASVKNGEANLDVINAHGNRIRERCKDVPAIANRWETWPRFDAPEDKIVSFLDDNCATRTEVVKNEPKRESAGDPTRVRESKSAGSMRLAADVPYRDDGPGYRGTGERRSFSTLPKNIDSSQTYTCYVDAQGRHRLPDNDRRPGARRCWGPAVGDR